MEAVPRLPMIFYELNTSPESVDFGSKLKQYIRDHYHENPETYINEIYTLESLRASAIHPQRDVAGCSLLKQYYCQLHFLQSRFPMSKDGKAAVSFTWNDLYSNSPTSLPDIRFEMVNVLYNIGALHSQLGAADSRLSEDGLKLACTHFQCAAWAFQHVKDSYPQMPGVNVAPNVMQFKHQVCLAQAQECILEKSMADNRKAAINAKVAVQIVDYYNMAMNVVTALEDDSSSSYSINPKHVKRWKRYVKFKSAYYACISLLYQGMQSEEQQKMGERVAYYQAASDKLQEAFNLSKDIENQEAVQEALAFTMDVVVGKKNPATKENDLIYHEKVPEIEALPDVKGKSLVRGIAFSVNDPEISGQDIFAKLVPMKAHEASSLYSEEKAKLLRKVSANIDKKDEHLVGFMSSLQLDYLNVFSQMDKIPQELVDCCAAMTGKTDAIQNLIVSMNSLAEVSTEVESMLLEIFELIQAEEIAEKEYQEVLGSRPPSIVATDLTREANKYQEAHKKASESNETLHKAMTLHITNLKVLLLPLEELQQQIPVLPPLDANEENILKELQLLVIKVDEMKRQRSMLNNQLRESICNDDITNTLIIKQNEDHEAIFAEELKKHDKIIQLIDQNLAAQENILKALTEIYAQFAPTRKRINEVLRKRTTMVSALLSSYEAYEDLLSKSGKGLKFYKKLVTNISKLLQRCKGTCKVQEEEREQILLKNGKFIPKPSSDLAPEPSANSSGLKLKDYLNSGKKFNIPPTTSPSLPPNSYYNQNLYHATNMPSSTGSTQPNAYVDPALSIPSAETKPQWVPPIRPAPLGSEGTNTTSKLPEMRTDYVPSDQSYQNYSSTAPYSPYGMYGQNYNYDSVKYLHPQGGKSNLPGAFNTSTESLDNYYNDPRNTSYPPTPVSQSGENTSSGGYPNQPISNPSHYPHQPSDLNKYISNQPQVPYQNYTPPTVPSPNSAQYPPSYPTQTSLELSSAQPLKNYSYPESAAQQPAYSNTQQPVYSNNQQPAYSNAQQPVYSNAQQPVYSNTQQPVYSKAQQPAYSSAQQPAYSNAQQPAYSSAQQPAYSSAQQPAYSNAQQPVYSNAQQPAYSNAQQPAYSSAQQPAYSNAYSTPAVTSNPYSTPTAVSNPYSTSVTVTNSYSTPAIVSNPYSTPGTTSNLYSIPAIVSNATSSTEPCYTYPSNPALSNSANAHDTYIPNHYYGLNSQYPTQANYATDYSMEASQNDSSYTNAYPSLTSNQQTSEQNLSSYPQYGYISPSPSPGISYSTQATNYHQPSLESALPTTTASLDSKNTSSTMYAQTPLNSYTADQSQQYMNMQYSVPFSTSEFLYMHSHQTSGYYTNAGQYVTLHTNSSQSSVEGNTYASRYDANVSQSKDDPNYALNSQYYNIPYGHHYQSPLQDGSNPANPANVDPDTPIQGNVPEPTIPQSPLTPQNSMVYMLAHTSNSGTTLTYSTNRVDSASNYSDAQSNIDLLAGLDFNLSQAPLIPTDSKTEPVVGETKTLEVANDASKVSISRVSNQMANLSLQSNGSSDEAKASSISPSQILSVLTHDEKVPQNKFPSKDPYDDPEVLNQFTQEVEKFDKFLEGLIAKTLNGPTSLDIKWKELCDFQEKNITKQSISVARCYPMKNRFPDILPYDSTRVELPSTKDDYINASFVKNISTLCPPAILTQAPLPATYSDFWTMVWEQQVELVVCLLTDSELENQIYWPNEKGSELDFGRLKLTLQSCNNRNQWMERIISITDHQKVSRNIVHLQLTSWPGSSFPASPGPFMSVACECLNLYRQQRNLTHPLVIHCLSGVGRSGLFLLALAAIAEINSAQGIPDLINLAGKMSLSRKNCLRDREHLKFAYQTVLYYAQSLLMKRGILTTRSSFEEKRKSHTRHPSEDFLLNPPRCVREVETPATVGSADHQASISTSNSNIISSPAAQQETTRAVSSEENKRRNEEVFKNANAGSMISSGQTSDPLSQIDPLWSMKKETEN